MLNINQGPDCMRSGQPQQNASLWKTRGSPVLAKSAANFRTGMSFWSNGGCYNCPFGGHGGRPLQFAPANGTNEAGFERRVCPHLTPPGLVPDRLTRCEANCELRFPGTKSLSQHQRTKGLPPNTKQASNTGGTPLHEVSCCCFPPNSTRTLACGEVHFCHQKSRWDWWFLKESLTGATQLAVGISHASCSPLAERQPPAADSSCLRMAWAVAILEVLGCKHCAALKAHGH